MVCQKNVGLRKFWLDLKISEVFLIGLKVLFSGDFFASWSLKFFPWQSCGFVVFCFCLFFLQEFNFPEFMECDIAYRYELVD